MVGNDATPALVEHTDVDRVAVALQDRTRRGILLALLRDPGPHTVDEVADRARVHRTVAFGHLERLVDLGLLRKDRRRGRLGKPAALYTPTETSLRLQYPPRQFAMLARLLAAGLRTFARRGVEAARESGRQFGQRVGDRDAASVEGALRPLEVLGAEYTVRGDRVDAANCVFLEACAQSRDVVCNLHAGILEGALRAAAIDVTVEPAERIAASGCAYVLRAHTPRA